MGNFGSRFSAALARMGYSQQSAAVLCGVSQRTISDYCRREFPPHPSKIRWLGMCLGIDEEDLVGKEAAGKMSAAFSRESEKLYKHRHPAITWFTLLRVSYRLHPNLRPSIELSISTAWPDQSKTIIEWLQRDPKDEK